MALRSSKEIRADVARKSLEELMESDKVESEAVRLSKLSMAKFMILGNTLRIKKGTIKELASFIVKYSDKKNITRSKHSVESVLLLGKDLLVATSLMFSNKRVLAFYGYAGDIIDSSILRHGRVLQRWITIARYWRRMDRLQAFYELHSARQDNFRDSRKIHIVLLKKDMVLAYNFMKRREED